jgi:parallel beta-helix repeat protein
MADSDEIDEAIAELESIERVLTQNRPESAGIRIDNSTNLSIAGNITGNYDVGMNIQDSSGIVALKNEISNNERGQILVHLDQTKSILEQMKGGENGASSLREQIGWFKDNAPAIYSDLSTINFMREILSAG